MIFVNCAPRRRADRCQLSGFDLPSRVQVSFSSLTCGSLLRELAERFYIEIHESSRDRETILTTCSRARSAFRIDKGNLTFAREATGTPPAPPFTQSRLSYYRIDCMITCRDRDVWSRLPLRNGVQWTCYKPAHRSSVPRYRVQIRKNEHATGNNAQFRNYVRF